MTENVTIVGLAALSVSALRVSLGLLTRKTFGFFKKLF
jgi:hypothetical protein